MIKYEERKVVYSFVPWPTDRSKNCPALVRSTFLSIFVHGREARWRQREQNSYFRKFIYRKREKINFNLLLFPSFFVFSEKNLFFSFCDISRVGCGKNWRNCLYWNRCSFLFFIFKHKSGAICHSDLKIQVLHRDLSNSIAKKFLSR